MAKSLSRAALDGLKPPGDLWDIDPGESLDQQLDAISDTLEDIRAVHDSLADIRNPYRTPVFTDLERNYGFSVNENVSIEIRQQRLARRVYQGEKVNSQPDIQADLDNAGFDLQVHKNDPPIDPAFFLDQSFNMTLGSDRAYLGYNEGSVFLSFLGRTGGDLLVNTPIRFTNIKYIMQCGGDVAYLGFNQGGDPLSCLGYFTEGQRIVLEYPIPTDPIYWGKIFFVGGDATRNESGELISINAGIVDLNRADELEALIMADKTSGAWAALIIDKV